MIFGDRLTYTEKTPYFKEKDCPFCQNSQEKNKYILTETDYRKVLYNKFPYYGEKTHLMAVPKRHVIYTYELNKQELEDYKNIELFMKDYYGAKNYFSFIRQSTGGRSVEHLHYHYLQGLLSYDEKSQDNIFIVKDK